MEGTQPLSCVTVKVALASALVLFTSRWPTRVATIEASATKSTASPFGAPTSHDASLSTSNAQPSPLLTVKLELSPGQDTVREATGSVIVQPLA
jgi:hypothetical protein